MKHIRARQAIALVLCAASVGTAAQPGKGKTAIVPGVYDSDPVGSKLVGTVVQIDDAGASAFTTVEFPSGSLPGGKGRGIAIVRPTGFQLQGSVLFESEDCSGNAFLGATGGSVFASFANSVLAVTYGVAGQDTLSLWLAPIGGEEQANIRSKLSANGGGSGYDLRVETRLGVDIPANETVYVTLAITGGYASELSGGTFNDSDHSGSQAEMTLVRGGGPEASEAIYQVTALSDITAGDMLTFNPFTITVSDSETYTERFGVYRQPSAAINGGENLYEVRWSGPLEGLNYCNMVDLPGVPVRPAILIQPDLHSAFPPPYNVIR